MTKEEILDRIEEEDVEFIRLQFTDMKGVLKNVAVTANQLGRVLDQKYIFDGTALTGEGRDNSEDLYLVPDLDTFVILPWRPQQGKVARFLCDVYHEDGTLCVHSPRRILKNVLEAAKKEGYTIYVDPENEFFLYHTDEDGMPTTVTHDQAGYMDIGPVDLGENARRDMVLALEDMGFEVESSHHEQAPAQHEIDFKESEALECADAIMTFRMTVRSIAKRFGLHATFMPKPCEGVPGSGMHLNLSVYKDGRNIFNTKDVNDVKDETRWFIGGILAHADGFCAISNPLVNSYKRLCSGFDAPLYKNWAVKKVNPLIRVRKPLGEDTKVELRFPDSSANPYLVIAVAVAAGLQGLREHTEPGAMITAPLKTSQMTKNKKLPITLVEALDDFKRDAFFKEVLGEEFMKDYIAMKTEEWDSYMTQVSAWEINRYLFRI